MLLTPANLHRLQSDGLTIVDLLVASVLNNVAVEWPRFVVGGVSDVDEARSVYLIPSDMQLTLFEREVSKESLHAQAAQQHRRLAEHVRGVFDVVLHRLPAGAVGLDGIVAARGRFPLLPDQARLRLHLRAGGVPSLQGPQPGNGLCREPRRVVNMKERHPRWTPTISAGSSTTPRTAASPRPCRARARCSMPPSSARGALLRGQVSRQVGITIRAVAEELIGRLKAANAALAAKPQTPTSKPDPAQTPSGPRAAEPSAPAKPAAQAAVPAAAPRQAAPPPDRPRPPLRPIQASPAPRPVPVAPVKAGPRARPPASCVRLPRSRRARRPRRRHHKTSRR